MYGLFISRNEKNSRHVMPFRRVMWTRLIVQELFKKKKACDYDYCYDYYADIEQCGIALNHVFEWSPWKTQYDQTTMGGGNRGKNHMGRAINQLTNLHIHVINIKVHTMRHINALILNSHITKIINILCLHMEATLMQHNVRSFAHSTFIKR